jgi:hypothetical protein
MGHVVNPTAFRLGRVLFWKFNFFHFRQKFIFNKYFFIGMHFYKIIYWLFYSPSTINFFFNRFVRFFKKRKFLKKFIFYNFFFFKSLNFFLFEFSRSSVIYNFFFFFKGPSLEIKNLKICLYSLFILNKNKLLFKKFITYLGFLIKRRRVGLLRFTRKDYKLVKRRKKRYFWLFKKSLEKNLIKLKHFISVRYRNLSRFGNLFYKFLGSSLALCSLVPFLIKMFFLRYFLKNERRKQKYLFRNKFKNLMIKLEIDSVIFNIQNNIFQLNMMIFKEFWLDDLKMKIFKMFYFSRRLKKWRIDFFDILLGYLQLIELGLKRRLICIFMRNNYLEYLSFEKLYSKQFVVLIGFKRNCLFNLRKFYYFSSCHYKKIILKFFYNVFFTKRLGSVLSKLFKRFYPTMLFKINFFFFKNSLMNAKTVFRFIFKQLTALRPINKIVYIVLLELRRTKLFAGFKILLRGRFTRRERAFSKVWISGQIPTSTITKKLDYYANTFISKFGVGSIRIWLYKIRV